MKLYELTYLPLPGLSEDEQKTLSEKVVSCLETSPTSQHSNGFVTTMNFNTEPEKIKEIEEKLKQETQVKRYLVLNKKPVKFKARILRRAEFSKKIGDKTGKPKIELQEIEKKLEEILKD
ncbi:MAG: hypothetical protein ABIG29_01705 [Candidatus Nealsonbacteria bacterium]